jgi:hypothetical protein
MSTLLRSEVRREKVNTPSAEKGERYEQVHGEVLSCFLYEPAGCQPKTSPSKVCNFSHWGVFCSMRTTGEEWVPGEFIIIPLLTWAGPVFFPQTIHTFIVLHVIDI